MNRRDEILQATLELIPQHGLSGLRISHIAEQANCSPGIIYHYFESKDEIIQSLGMMVSAEFGRSLQVDHLLTLTPFERLKQGWLNTFTYFTTYPQKTLFLEQYKNSPYHTEEAWGPELEKLVQAVSLDIANGHLKDFPITVLYNMTINVAISLAKQVIRGQLVADDMMLDNIATACCQAIMV
jgi:AcrR family transcriptional regulator